MKYVCELCGSIYDEDQGDPRHGIPAGTAFENLPEEYTCPGCGSEREAYDKLKPRRPMVQRKSSSNEAWQSAIYTDAKDLSDR